MAYLALYRKFRPQTFSDVKGQDHIVRTLENQIKTDRIGHAYLFTGTRGTGKTTIAKIFAKAVNCKHIQEDGDPCNECDSCRAITEGRSMDVLELDAASNNSVENIRDIIDSMAYPPSDGRYKVYIIDEVHMLSNNAFNALLKSLEEPPEYVIFILATTEVNKIPQTILSRCQRYEFHRISIETISARIKELCAKENVEIDDKAVHYVAKAADGSMRDALSLLDECIAFYSGQTLTYDNVLSVLGAVDTAIFSRLLRDVMHGNTLDALKVVDDVLIEGRELTQFANDFDWYLRNLLLVKNGETDEEVLGMSSDNMKALMEEAEEIDSEVIIRYIRIVSNLADSLKYSGQKRVLTEVAVIKLCNPAMESDTGSLADRIGKIENAISSGELQMVSGAAGSGGAGFSPSAQAQSSAIPSKKKLPAALPEDIEELMNNWDKFKSTMPTAFKGYLGHSTVTLDDDGTLLIVFDAKDDKADMAYNMLNQNDNRERLQNQLNAVTNKNIKFSLELNETGLKNTDIHEDLLAKFSAEHGVKISVEDF